MENRPPPSPPPPQEHQPDPKKLKMSATTSDEETTAADDKTPRYKRRKIAIFFAYCGVGYQGMQKNPGAKTIEGDLEEALFLAGAVPERDRGCPKRYDWARSARTDKGVSAVGQVVSGRFYIDPPGLIARLNQILPPQFRIFGYKRVTASFSAKKFCDRRRYVYLIPVFALDPNCHRDRESVLASVGSGNELVKCFECSERGRKVIGVMGKRGFDLRSGVKVVSVQSDISSNTGAALSEAEVKVPLQNGNVSENKDLNSESVASVADNESALTKSVVEEEMISINNVTTELEPGEQKSDVEILSGGNGGDEDEAAKHAQFSYGEVEKERFNRILKYYEGTHNFHNFTTRTKAEDPSARRFIISFNANTTVMVDGIEFIKCEVIGQSFMLHQIRKMIGVAVAIMRNCAPESLIETALKQDVRINVPTAPEVGLYLDECFFTSYNEKWKDTHEEVSMKDYAEEAEEFKMKHIYSHIASMEHKEGAVALWLHSLNYRNYPDLQGVISGEKTDDITDEAEGGEKSE